MMGSRVFYTSLTRCSDLRQADYETTWCPREAWADGDFVSGIVKGAPSALYRLELDTGRMVDVLEGDRLVGALGQRRATLEGVGDWRAAEDDNAMHVLTGAGLLGRLTSVSPYLPHFIRIEYLGHVTRDGDNVTMSQFVKQDGRATFRTPVILLVGSSMSAGKTTTGRLLIHELAMAGHDVIGAKLTGAGRYQDILAFRDAGARAQIDFVDAGLPSTVVDADIFRRAMTNMMSRIADLDADILVAESGASPLEPYNGALAIQMLSPHVFCTILCTSDPYSVLGAQRAFRFAPDLVSGPATNTVAGVDLVQRLTGVRAISAVDPVSRVEMRDFVLARLQRHLERRRDDSVHPSA